MDITRLTVHELMEKLEKNELTSEEITKAYVDRINEKEKDVKAFVTTSTKALTVDSATFFVSPVFAAIAAIKSALFI